MHGRIKTISSKEQKERQQKAREIKLKAYTSAMTRIILKREVGENDDEALFLTQEILLSNPNISTLWNYRREIILSYKELLEIAKWEEMLVSDLLLTEQCLRSDPKSYCAWHHRLWLLDNLPTKAWHKELKLCNKMLEVDERNFHCWDYRQIVVDRAGIPMQDYYDFTTSKIESNFSNYSAWHFRSKLLPKLFEDPEGKYPVAESKHREELELVQNAAFTDPEDQSAWFYQRWLLNLRTPCVSFAWANADKNSISVAFSKSLCSQEINDVQVMQSNRLLDGEWFPIANNKASTVWKFNFLSPVNIDDSIDVLMNSNEKISVKCNSVTTKDPNFVPATSSDLKETLQEQLQSCRELLELEPDSKWTLLTSALLMKCLDLRKNNSAILEALLKLGTVDRYRRGYYADLTSMLVIELELIDSAFSDSILLSNRNLHCLYHMQYLSLTKSVDLSENKLSDCDLKQLYPLVACTDLNLDGNLITSIKNLPFLPKLSRISLRRNPITDAVNDEKYLNAFNSLTVVWP